MPNFYQLLYVFFVLIIIHTLFLSAISWFSIRIYFFRAFSRLECYWFYNVV